MVHEANQPNTYNPFSHTDTSWKPVQQIIFVNIKQFPLLPQHVQLFIVIIFLFMKIFHIFLSRFFQCRLQQMCCIWKLVNPFPHTTILQQTTLNIFCQKIVNLYNWKDYKPMTKTGKHCGKRRNCSFWAISSFVTMFL